MLARARTKLDMDKKIIQGGRFDNKSTDKERDAFLKAILDAQADDDDDDVDLVR
jgi:ATP-dependent helicase STH1/SNF2